MTRTAAMNLERLFWRSLLVVAVLAAFLWLAVTYWLRAARW
jgi:hypothetical protein